LLQDSKCSIKLEANGQASASKSHELINNYFLINDLKEKGHITVEYCPTDRIHGDYMSKPLHGKKFNVQQNAILNVFPATAACLMMSGYFQAGPTKKSGNILKHSDA